MWTRPRDVARLLYCRHVDCREAYVSDAGKVPAICPACTRPSSWTTTPPIVIVPIYADPTTVYTVSMNDARFLRSLRIDPEWPPPD